MQQRNLNEMEDSKIVQNAHRFGNYDDENPSLFCVKMPFGGKGGSERTNVDCDVDLDVIEGDITFLLGLPALIAIDATLNHKYLTLAPTVNGKYHRFQLFLDEDHLYIPFEPHTVVISIEGQGSEGNARVGCQKYYSRWIWGREYYSTGHRKVAKVESCASATVDVASLNNCPSFYTI